MRILERCILLTVGMSLNRCRRRRKQRFILALVDTAIHGEAVGSSS